MTETKADAVLALIRDRVIDDEAEHFLGLDVTDCEISRRADRRIRRMIKRERAGGSRGITVFKRVAVAVAVIMTMLLLMSLTFPEPPDPSKPVYEGTPGKVGIWFEQKALKIAFEIGLKDSDKVGKIAAGEPSYIPDGYTLTQTRGDGDKHYELNYYNEDGDWLSFDRDKVGDGALYGAFYSYSSIDDYQCTAEYIKVHGYAGAIVTYPKDWWHQYVLIFCDGSYKYSFHVCDPDMSLEELMHMAESIYD